MAYVIYNKDTTRLLNRTMYKTLAAAKRARTMACRYGSSRLTGLQSQFSIAEVSEFYKSIEKTEVKKSLLSGKEFVQPVNTPLCCDPSSETYWSM